MSLEDICPAGVPSPPVRSGPPGEAGGRGGPVWSSRRAGTVTALWPWAVRGSSSRGGGGQRPWYSISTSPARTGSLTILFSILRYSQFTYEMLYLIFSESESQTQHSWPSLPEGAGRAYHGCALINKGARHSLETRPGIFQTSQGGGIPFTYFDWLQKTHLIIAGGKDTRLTGSSHLRSSWVLDMVSGVWSQTSHLQVRRDETVLTNVGGRVVAIAGYEDKEYWQQLEEFQPQLNRSVVAISQDRRKIYPSYILFFGILSYLI